MSCTSQSPAPDLRGWEQCSRQVIFRTGPNRFSFVPKIFCKIGIFFPTKQHLSIMGESIYLQSISPDWPQTQPFLQISMIPG